MSFRSGFVQSPAFGYSLGLCALIAVSQTFERGLIYSLSWLASFIMLSLLSPLISKMVPSRLTPFAIASVSCIPVMACFVLAGIYDRDARNSVSIWLLLISVEPFLRRQVETQVASDDFPRSFLVSSGKAISYVVAFMLFSAVREFISSGSLSVKSGIDTLVFKPLFQEGAMWGFFALVPGAFILVGYGQALFVLLSRRKGNRPS